MSDGAPDLRVAFVSHYRALYGANRSLLDLIRGLRERGVEAAVLCPGRGPVTGALEEEGIPYRVLGFRKWWSRTPWKGPLRLAANLLVMPALLRQLRAWEVDLVYTNSAVVPVGAWAARLLGLPHVWHLREFGREHYGLRHDLGRGAFRFWLRRAAALVAVSEALRARFEPDAGGRPIHVVYNGVVTRRRARELREAAEARGSQASAVGGAGDRPAARTGDAGERAAAPRGPGDAPVRFATVGRLGGQKRQDEAVDALALLRARGVDARLRLVGSGPEAAREALAARAAARGVEAAVEFPGFVPDPFEIYREADAVLVCSRAEAMGRVTAEAMLACRPVVGYRGGGTPELVADGETGLLYDGGAEALADAMERLARRPELRRRMGLAAWERAFPELTVEACAERIHGILEDVAGAAAQPAGRVAAGSRRAGRGAG